MHIVFKCIPFCSETKFWLDSVLRHLRESSSGMLDAVHLSLFAALSIETIWQRSKRWLNKMISSCCCVTCPILWIKKHDPQHSANILFFFFLPLSPSPVRIQMVHKCLCHLCVLMAHNHEQVVQMALSVTRSVPAA